MAGHSESSDAADIFWPGYVDAVSNLAINLLFVIAVLVIFALAAVTQIGENSKAKNAAAEVDGGKKQGAMPVPEMLNPEVKTALEQAASEQITQARLAQVDSMGTASANTETADKAALVKALAAQKIAQQEAAEKASELKKTQQALTTALASLKTIKSKPDESSAKDSQSESAQSAQAAKSASGSTAQSKSASPTEASGKVTGNQQLEAPVAPPVKEDRLELVQATQKQAIAANAKNESSLGSNGVLVAFSPDAIDLSDAEAAEVVSKINTFAPLANSQWVISVVSPKGFSEATRLAYYRVNALRNLLLKNGASPASIELSIVESESPSANNTRVLVRPK
jgi:hypothetical protein